MTGQERKWIETAIKTLEGAMTPMARVKILRTISQIYARSADKIEFDLVDKVENRLYNTNTQTEKETTDA
jgi:hypothetical protein